MDVTGNLNHTYSTSKHHQYLHSLTRFIVRLLSHYITDSGTESFVQQRVKVNTSQIHIHTLSLSLSYTVSLSLSLSLSLSYTLSLSLSLSLISCLSIYIYSLSLSNYIYIYISFTFSIIYIKYDLFPLILIFTKCIYLFIIYRIC